MIAKIYKFKEKELKKVLRKWKPFFSHDIVLNSGTNTCNHNRFWVVIGGKSVVNSVERNFFRRAFYNEVQQFCSLESWWFFDCVFVVKKQAKLDAKDEKNVAKFKKDIHFLLRKVFNNKTQKTWRN